MIPGAVATAQPPRSFSSQEGLAKYSLCRRARCSPPGSVLSRAHIYGYGRSLRPPQGTTIAPQRRAVFHQTLLEPLAGRLAGAPDAIGGGAIEHVQGSLLATGAAKRPAPGPEH